MQIQMRNPTAGDLMSLAVPEIASKSTLFAGSNTGISFRVLGPYSSDRILVTVFFVGLVDTCCVVLTVVLKLVLIVALSPAIETLVDGCVGVISVDFPELVAFTKRNLGNEKRWVHFKIFYNKKTIMEGIKLNRSRQFRILGSKQTR